MNTSTHGIEFINFLIEQGLSESTASNYSGALLNVNHCNHGTAINWWKKFCKQFPQSIDTIAGTGKLINPLFYSIPPMEDANTDYSEIDKEIENIDVSTHWHIIHSIKELVHANIEEEHKLILIKSLFDFYKPLDK
jgi:hypothetical protein